MLAADPEYQAARERLTLATHRQVGSIWREIGDDFDRGWPVIAPAIVATITDAQEGAAADGLAYFDAAMSEQGITPKQALIDPAAFAGSAYTLDGLALGDLSALTYGAVVRARSLPATSLAERIDAGSKWLGTITQTQLAHAGRASMSTKMTADAQAGWTRTVNPPCCRFCGVRAGTFHTWNYAFWQHPGCDCTRTPTTLDRLGDTATDIGPDDITGLSMEQREAIRDGADIAQVINSDRGRSRDGLTTSEGTTRRGFGYHALGKDPRNDVRIKGERNFRTTGKRLTPDGIYAIAKDRDEAITLLRQHGYIYL